jgi:hypothetical protein
MKSSTTDENLCTSPTSLSVLVICALYCVFVVGNVDKLVKIRLPNLLV